MDTHGERPLRIGQKDNFSGKVYFNPFSSLYEKERRKGRKGCGYVGVRWGGIQRKKEEGRSASSHRGLFAWV